MQQTPLITRHRAAGAKLVDFAGWEMPIQYSGVVDEYHTVRSHAGLFDVSHMGRLVVSGSGATAFLQRLTTNNVARLSVGQAHYSMVCNEQGGIKDDIFVYRTADAEFLLCVNASNRLKILDWIRMHHRADHQCRIEDRSADLAQIAIQGPASMQVMLKLGFVGTGDLKLHHTCQGLLAGIPCFIARTGYTGEPGYELNVEAAQAPVLWDRMIDAGRPHGVKPAGLGARDLLRLEMGYLLYGNDIEEDRTPLEANAVWTVNFEKGDFMGRSALLAQAQAGISRRLVGFELLEKAVPRHAFKILSSQPHVGLIGEVTSGNFSPLLQKGIGLGYVPFDYTTSGGPLMIDVRGKLVPARVVKPPFYKRSS